MGKDFLSNINSIKMPGEYPISKYRKVIKKADPAQESEIRVRVNSPPFAYAAYAGKLLLQKDFDYVYLNATGAAVSSSIKVIEYLKTHIKGLHISYNILSKEFVDEYEPKVEGLDKVTTTRTVSTLEAKLTIKKGEELAKEVGYMLQAPTKMEVTEEVETEEVETEEAEVAVVIEEEVTEMVTREAETEDQEPNPVNTTTTRKERKVATVAKEEPIIMTTEKVVTEEDTTTTTEMAVIEEEMTTEMVVIEEMITETVTTITRITTEMKRDMTTVTIEITETVTTIPKPTITKRMTEELMIDVMVVITEEAVIDVMVVIETTIIEEEKMVITEVDVVEVATEEKTITETKTTKRITRTTETNWINKMELSEVNLSLCPSTWV